MHKINGAIGLTVAIAGGILIAKFLPALIAVGMIAAVMYLSKDESSAEETNEECQYGKQTK